MSDTTTTFGPEDCCWAADGWENAGEGSVRDARKVGRDKARADFARWACEPWVEARVWKRHLRPLSRQEKYEWWVESRTDEGWEGNPGVAPEGWDDDLVTYDEDAPQWEFVHRLHAEAIPVWVCGWRNDSPPHNPRLPVSGGDEGNTP